MVHVFWHPSLAGVALAIVLALPGRDGGRSRSASARPTSRPTSTARRPVWIAGYGHNRKATGVHDPLCARAVVLKTAPEGRPGVGRPGRVHVPEHQERAQELDGFDYVLVASTHDHEGPDTIGLWGPSFRESGVDPTYLERAERGIVAAVRQAEAAAVSGTAEYGTAEGENLLSDSRLPIVKDGVIRVLRFSRPPTAVPSAFWCSGTATPRPWAARTR